MVDFLYRYNCAICGMCLSIPLKNINLESEDKGIYEQFSKIINNTNKECNFCGNNNKFYDLKFPIEFLGNGEKYLLEII